MLTLWERVARSVYNMFSVPCQEKIRVNKGDVHNCRLYYKMEIDTRVCVHVVRMIRLTKGLFDKSGMKQPDIFEAMKSIELHARSKRAGHTSA